MTLEQALKEAASKLTSSSTPRLDAEILLGQIMGLERSQLISQGEELLSVKHYSELQKQLQERQEGKPIAYITHNKEFYHRDYFVDERVLIPRPETEEMVEDAIKQLKENPTPIIDLGCGSGCIAITMALEFPDLKVTGLEISQIALEVAQKNLQRHPVKNLSFIQSDLLSNYPETSEPLTILANLPYIGREENHFISEETQAYEPDVALFGGSDGLELYRQTWEQIKVRHFSIQALFMEIGFSQAEQIMKEATDAFPDHEVTLKEDLAGLPRTVIIRQ